MAEPAIVRGSNYYTDSTDNNTSSINYRRANRGLIDLDNVIVPKGQWIIGSTASYSAHNNNDYTLLIVEDINSIGYTFKISPMISYALANNITIGTRFVYGRSLLKIEDASLSFGDSESGGINLVVNDYYSLQHSYSAMVLSRQYIPLGKSKRYALFNEMQLSLGGSQSKMLNDTPVQGTYATGFNASLGISPGIMAFATDYIAIEVNVGVMGVGYSETKQVYNQVSEGKVSNSTMSFKINIFSIGFGFAFYL